MSEEMEHLPRLVIAAPQGHSGKTTVSLGLCAALRGRGLAIQPFKKGPDYIDPSWLSEAAGRACRSLDPFFLEEPAAILKAFAVPARQVDLSLVEGNHGLFDSFDEEGTGSTAAVARNLQAPILLVLNTARTGRSAAAIVKGCQVFEEGTPIAGVVLNNIARGRHEARIRSAIDKYCGIPVLGALPASAELEIPDRHLGLIPRAEGEGLLPVIEACARAAETFIDIGKILEVAKAAPALKVPVNSGVTKERANAAPARIGVMRDKAFTFYYPENLEALEQAGAELVYIDAFQAESLPNVQALYIGGGFPEIFMQELAANRALLENIRQAAEAGLPIYAECGGMMYLSRRIRWGTNSAEMAGVLPCEIDVMEKPQGHGYVSARVDGANPIFPIGSRLLGHEFHNSRITHLEGIPSAYELRRGTGTGDKRDGLVYKNVLAAYTHLHAGGNEAWARGLVECARQQTGESR